MFFISNYNIFLCICTQASKMRNKLFSDQDWTKPLHWLDGYWFDLRSDSQLKHEMPLNYPNVATLLLTNIFTVTFKNKNECFKARKGEMEFGYVKFSWIPTNRVGNSNSLSSVLLPFQLSRLAVLLTWSTSQLHSYSPSTAIQPHGMCKPQIG